ncbi:MAG: hypothetical protein HPY69_13815 [Armatimonadetes bacterium]|nr:hypothetical protein [Armatimonadota bacterium]
MAATEIMFVAGEPSGDLHSAQLAVALRQRADMRLTGAGGPRMRAAGVQTDFAADHWGAIGVAEALTRVPGLYLKKLALLRLVRQRRPALIIYVDFGAFNVRLARSIRRLPFHQPAMYYFPPASWDRSPRDRSELAALVDVVATPFPWSAELLRRDGVNAHFVGHPVLDRLAPAADQPALRRSLGLPEAERYVGLLPGSRRIERRLLGPQMLLAAQELAADDAYHFLWSSWPGEPAGQVEGLPGLEGRITALPDSAAILQASDLVLTAFGTATLEAAVAECPMLTMYRGTPAMRLQYRLMRISTEFYAMPNIIAQRRIVPELIQEAATGPALAAQVRALFAAPGALAEMRAELREVRQVLGEPGVAARTAELALQTIQGAREGSD